MATAYVMAATMFIIVALGWLRFGYGAEYSQLPKQTSTRTIGDRTQWA